MKFPAVLHNKGFDYLHALVSAVLRCAFMLLMVSGLVGCLLIAEDKTYRSLFNPEKTERQIYKLYPGQHLPASELAILLLNDIPSVDVNGLGVFKTDYQEIHLLPGRHALAWRQVFGFSVMVEPSMQKSAEIALEVELRAGHTYTLHADRSTGHGYRFYFWITDASSGEVVGGLKKP